MAMEPQRRAARRGVARPQAIGENIAPAPVAVASPFGRPFAKRIGMSHVLAFTEQLADLLEAGLPLDRALHLTSGTVSHPRLQTIIEGVFVEVEKGRTLADAFALYPQVFPRLYVNMVRAGEEGGALQIVLQRLIEFYRRTIEFRSFLVVSSIYPVTLLVFGLVAMMVLSVFVIPKFGEIFADMHQALPVSAAVLINFGTFLRDYGLILMAAVGLLIFGAYSHTRGDAGREQWQRFVLRVPLVGDLILKAELSRIFRTLGTLLASGVPVLACMRIVQGLTDNIPLLQSLERLQRGVKEGEGLARPLLADPLFPRMLGQLAAIGEESGALDRMLIKASDQYETEIKKATKALIAIFEPVVIIVMGSLIGLVVVSMLTAIFSINDLPL